MKKYLVLFIVVFFVQHAFAQDFSNKGKDFWISYPEHINGTSSVMGLYITSDVSTTGIVTVNGANIPFTLTANTVNSIFLGPNGAGSAPNSFIHMGGIQDGIKVGGAIHIVATKPVVVYAHIIFSARSGASLILPTNVWGKEYIVPSYKNDGGNGGGQGFGEINIMSSLPNTLVEITPQITTRNGLRTAGVPYQITLANPGDVYQVQFPQNTDMSGTTVKSIASGSSSCQPIAVISATTWTALNCSNGNGGDNFYQQLFPYSTWGKQFLTSPLKKTSSATDHNIDIVRVFVKDPTTVVQRTQNGITSTLTGIQVGNFYEYNTEFPTLLQADKAIQVIQYITTQNCGSPQTQSDPEMISLSSVEQTINDITVFSAFQANVPAGQSNVTTHYINVVMKSAHTSTFKINGLVPTSAFIPIPSTNYSYLKQNIPTTGSPVSRLTSDSGFSAIAYGFGNVESYGYNAGTNVKSIGQDLVIQNQLSTLPQSTACSNSPFVFKVYLPDSAKSNITGITNLLRYDSMKWSVTTPTAFTPNNFPVMVKPINQTPPGSPMPPYYPNPVVRADSTNTVLGKKVAWYSIVPPTNYAVNISGPYTLTVTGYSTNVTDGCATGNETVYEFPFIVAPPPVPDFINTTPGCPADSVRFTETTLQLPYPTYKFWWDFGEPSSGANNNSTLRNPVHAYANPGTYSVKFGNITTAGCISDTISKTVVVPILVNATITGTTTLCQNATQPTITFTGTNGVLPYTFTYNINGGAAQTISTTGTNTSVTLLAPTNIVGPFAYNLVKVENANPAFCSRVITGQTATVTVNPLPTATITGAINVCQNTTAPLITFTGANATAPYTFTYNINGGTNQTITTTSGNSVTLAAPTTSVGTFNYNLVSVVDASTTLCSNTAVGSAQVVVQATPTATITGTISLCKDAAAPSITFNGVNGIAPFTFTYNINGGATQTVSTIAPATSITIPVSMAATGTFVYNLLSVQNTGPTTCITNFTTASATVIINPVPTATISGTTSVCQVAGAQTVTLTGAGGTAPYTFTYSINGVTQPTIVSTGNIATIIAPVTTVGTFVYNIISIKDASSTLCIKNYPLVAQPSATVVVQATSTATIAGSTIVCQNNTAPVITFTAANGVAPFTFTYNINGGTTQTISTIGAATSVTLPVSLAATGTFVYNLLSVKNTGSINCTTPITGATATVVINPVPTATIAGTTTVCQNTTAPIVTFTGANGTAPYTFNYTLNSVPLTVTTTSGNSVTLNAPTGTPGTFNYVITSVKDASATACTQTQAGTATITVKQLATATISSSMATICQNSTALPTITFTATGGVAPYTFTYTINGGANLTTTTTTGNTKTITVPTTTAGTYIYALVSVQESSVGGLCVNPQIGSAQVIVQPQPTASFTTAAPYCAFKDVIFTPAGTISAGSITSWVWNYDNGTGANVRTDQLPFTINYPTAGVKNVTYKTISNLGCESVLFTAPVTINSKPKAGFISPESCLADAFAQFTDTSTVVGGTIVFWEWDFGDATPILAGSGPTFQNPQHAYTTVGLKTVKLIVTSNSGCKDTLPAQSFFINGEVTSADFIVQTPTALCSNRPVFIKENSVVNVGGLIRVEIYWDNLNFPAVKETDELPTSGKIYVHNYTNLQIDKTYQIRYIAYTGFDGTCQKEIIKDIVVHASPIAIFTAPLDVCLYGGPVTLNTGTPTGGTGVYIGAGVSLVGGVYTFNPLAVGVTIGNTNNVTYAVTSPAGCDSALVRPIRVLAPPVINTFTTIGNLCRVNDIIFHNTTTNGDGTITKWIYDWGDGSPIQTMLTGADVTHQYITAGPKTVTLTIETGYGCKSLPRTLNIAVNPLPVPSYTFTNSACLPAANITFTNTMANQANFNYVWSFELPSATAPNTSVLPNPSHVYTNLGPHSTHLIATNNTTGCKDSTAIIIIDNNTIHPAPVVVFNTIPDVCLNNGTVILNQASETSGIPLNGGAVYSGVGVSLVGANYIFNPLATGVVVGLNTITVTFTSTFNCPTVKTQTLRVLAKPVVDVFTTLGNKCEQNATVFHNETTQGAGIITNWVYNWGDGSPLQTVTTGADITHFYALANTYNVTLTLITDYGCKSDVKPLTVIINPIPKPNFIFSDTVCLPAGKVFFTNTSLNTLSNTYSWIFNDIPPTIKTTVNTDFTYTNIGPHPVKLIATNATTFCRDSISKSITTIHPAPVAAFDFSVPSVCLATSVFVMDRSTFADGVSNKWEWSWGDATVSSGVSPAPHTYGTAQTYNVVLKVTNSFGCFDDSSRAFTVHPYPVVNAGKDSVILQGGNLILSPTVTGNDLSYLWTGTPAPINLSSTTALNPIASPLEDITYRLLVTARGGCSRFDEVFIKVLKAPIIPNTFTPNNDGVHDLWIIKYLESYPDAKVQVFTRTGQLVFQSKRYLNPWNGTMNGKSLPFDTYYYIIEPGTGRKPMTGFVTIVK
ncbi:MAG: PKD domain-containing protein [Ferruginibacter sp.]|nr:T9SS type B sorting domain-containing protein [Ferruginibacter sp.]